MDYRRKKKALLTMMLLFALTMGAFSPMSANPAEAKKAAVKLSKKSVSLLFYGSEYTLKVKNLPKKAKTTWAVAKGKKSVSLTDKKRTSVRITPKEIGKAKVIAKIKLPKVKKITKLVCTVKVKAWETAAPDPEITLPPHITPEGKADLQISADGVLTSAKLDNVYEVEIPEGVKEIADGVFQYCHTLEKITLPEGLVKIGSKAFNDCTRLNDVVFPSTMKTIGKEAFFECSSLKNIKLNDGLISIGAGSFFQCKNLKDIVIPSSVTEVGAYSFAWCDELESAQINAPLTEIPHEMFDNCGKLKTVNIPETVKKIGSRAFNNNSALESLILPKGLDEVGDYAFENAFISEQEIDAKVIGEHAFSGSGLKKITLSSNVTEIGKNALESCGDMEEGTVLTIPASVKKVTWESFIDANVSSFKVESGNTVLKAVKGVLFSADGKKLIAFPHFKVAKNYTVPAGVEEICERALEACKVSERIVLNEGLKKIDDLAFRFTEVKEITLPEGLESIGSNAFYSTSLTELIIPDSVTELGDSAFASMTKLKKIKLPTGLKSIPYDLLRECGTLKSVKIPDSVEWIDPTAFAQCTKLKGLSGLKFGENSHFSIKDNCLLDNTGTKLICHGDIMDGDDSLPNSFTIPDGIKEIGDYAFQSDVTAIYVPDSVEKIGKYALGFLSGKDRTVTPGIDSTFHIISTSETALDYAKENGVNIVSEEDPDYVYKHNVKMLSESEVKDENIKKIALKAGETATMEVKGVLTKPLFFSSDKKIATVDDKGVIKAVANGTTTIIEAVGFMYFCLEVTVTGGQDPIYDESLKIFKDCDEPDVAAWEKLYFDHNSGIWFTGIDYPAIETYSGNTYNSVTASYFGRNSGSYKTFITDLYGEGNGEYFTTISVNLKKELSEPKLDRDILLFSGKKAEYGVDYVTVDGKATMESLLKSVGTTATYPNVISTSLYRSVADGFSNGANSAIFEIEGRADKVNGMLIRGFSQFPAETEFLLNQGVKFKIVDVGIKRFTVGEKSEAFDSKDVSVKPYIRMQIV